MLIMSRTFQSNIKTPVPNDLSLDKTSCYGDRVKGHA